MSKKCPKCNEIFWDNTDTCPYCHCSLVDDTVDSTDKTQSSETSKKRSFLASALIPVAVFFIFYVWTHAYSIISGHGTATDFHALGIKSVQERLAEMTASLDNNKIELLYKIKVSFIDKQVKIIAYVKNTSGKTIENLMAEFVIKDEKQNVLATASDYLSMLKSYDKWKIVATTYVDYSGKIYIETNRIQGIVK